MRMERDMIQGITDKRNESGDKEDPEGVVLIARKFSRVQ